jgi:hypothetical protein
MLSYGWSRATYSIPMAAVWRSMHLFPTFLTVWLLTMDTVIRPLRIRHVEDKLMPRPDTAIEWLRGTSSRCLDLLRLMNDVTLEPTLHDSVLIGTKAMYAGTIRLQRIGWGMTNSADAQIRGPASKRPSRALQEIFDSCSASDLCFNLEVGMHIFPFRDLRSRRPPVGSRALCDLVASSSRGASQSMAASR